MKESIVYLFETYPFLQTEWFYTALSFILALFTATFMVVAWRKDSKQKIVEEQKQTLAKIIEIDMRLKVTYRECWGKISAFKGDANKEIFFKDVKDIESDEIRTSIFYVIDVLADVFYYYKKFGIELDDHWVENFNYTFNPKRKKAFVSAFFKYELSSKLNKEYILFVKSIIANNQKQDLESNSKKEQKTG